MLAVEMTSKRITSRHVLRLPKHAQSQLSEHRPMRYHLVVDTLKPPAVLRHIPEHLADESSLQTHSKIVPLHRPFPPFLCHPPAAQHVYHPAPPPVIQEGKWLMCSRLVDLYHGQLPRQLIHRSSGSHDTKEYCSSGSLPPRRVATFFTTPLPYRCCSNTTASPNCVFDLHGPSRKED